MKKDPLLPGGRPSASHRACELDGVRAAVRTPGPGMTTTTAGPVHDTADRFDESDVVARMSWEDCPNTDGGRRGVPRRPKEIRS
jgi:hypothetical protein